MITHADSHIDHALTIQQLAYINDLFAQRDGFFIERIELPPELGTVPCALYGPIVGDPPVDESRVSYRKRGAREYTSRMVELPPRPTRKVTIIAGPHDGHSCVLFTVYGGPLALREPNDPTLPENERDAAIAFWRDHALAILQ